jgi:hypothetical protein
MDELTLTSTMSNAMNGDSFFNTDISVTSKMNDYYNLDSEISSTLELNSIIP